MKRQKVEADKLINALGLVIGKRYKGTYFLGGVHEGELVEVWRNRAVLKLDNGDYIESIDVYTLVDPNQTPPESSHVRLSDLFELRKINNKSLNAKP